MDNKMTPTRENYLSGAISHHDYYIGLAKLRGINLHQEDLWLFKIDSLADLRVKYRDDKCLNNIPLMIFDSLTDSYNLYNRNTPMSLAEGCCLYKELLIELIDHPNQ